ncbi:MAG: hypothetical protein ACJA1M_000421, partial [Alphaproteobacteria bacterium]
MAESNACGRSNYRHGDDDHDYDEEQGDANDFRAAVFF